MIRYGSVCSGIEAATVAWHVLGWRAAWFSEIDPFASKVLKHRYPRVPNLGDMTRLASLIRSGLVEAPDKNVGGTPCQAYSVAGARAGLLDPRGQLTLCYADLVDAIDEQRADDDECVFVWENVPGVLSDKTNAFGCFLGSLAGEDDALLPPGKSWPNAGIVHGPQRTIAWRVLDAQYFGVAQRRRRVFVVGSARKGFDPAKLLFEFDSVRRDSPPSREAREEITGTLASRTHGGGFPGSDEPTTGFVRAVETYQRTAGTLCAADGKGKNGQDAYDDKFITCMAHGQGGAEVSVGLRPTLTCNHEAPIIAFNSNAQPDQTAFDPAVSAALTCSQNSAVAVPHVATMPTLRAGVPASSAGHGARSGDSKDEYTVPVCVTRDVTHTLKADGFDGSEDGTGRGQPIVSVAHTTGAGYWQEGFGTLRARTQDSHENIAIHGMAVRRLTPRECERLQSFPDDHTLIPTGKPKSEPFGGAVAVQDDGGKWHYFKPAADGPRYKALGNSMCVYNMRWLGIRLLLTHPSLFAHTSRIDKG